MQTGSSLSVDYLLNQSNIPSYFGENPHALFLANHGGSYLSGGNGDGPEHDLDKKKAALQVKDFAASLKNAIASHSSDGARLGLVAYDECLMANIELVTELSTSTRYVLASQESIPGNGYDYFLTLSDFKATTNVATQEGIETTAKNLGNAFVDNYSARNPSIQVNRVNNYTTLSLTDTDKVGSLNKAIKAYGGALIDSSDSFIASLLNSILQKGTGYSSSFLQDLGNVALITKSAPNASKALITASDAILSALGKAVINNNQNYNPLAGFKLNASSGLTITLPTDPIHANYLESKFKSAAPAFEAATNWSQVLDRIKPIIDGGSIITRSQNSKAITTTSEISKQVGEEALIALKIEGYLSYTSNNQAINQTKIALPELEGASIADLTFYFNALNLNKSGSITLAIEDKTGKEKASWQQTINNAELYSLTGAELDNSVKSLTIEAGDMIKIVPDESIAVRYDLDLTINDQSLQSFQDWTTPAGPASPQELITFNTPILLNTKADDGIESSFIYKTPVATQSEPFTTDIVLLSGSDGETSLTIKELRSDLSITFTSDTYIDEYIKFAGDTEYEFTFSYDSSDSTNNIDKSSDVSLLVDHYASETFLLEDSVLTQSIELSTWGQYSVNQTLLSELIITEMGTDTLIKSLGDLREGQLVDAQVSTTTISSSSTLNETATGGTQTFTSGIWSSEFAYTFNTILEGTSANAARFGFFEVDTLTGGINTEAGLIAASNSDAYEAAALENLITPLINLKGRNKSGSFVADIEVGTDYAAILLTTDQSGKETALFSIANANANQNAQLLNFNNGYFGWEDLVKGRDAGYDGDFNDLTFQTT